MTTILLGLFGGILGTLLWEVTLKPRWDGRSIALLLSSEVSLNMKLLAAAEKLAKPDRLPIDLELSTRLFDASTDRLGLLPAKYVREVDFLYRYFETLNTYPVRYKALRDRLNELPIGDLARRMPVESELKQTVAVFNDTVKMAINRANITQPLLLAAARPWWHHERWTDQAPKELGATALATTLEKSQQRRDALEMLTDAAEQEVDGDPTR